MQWQAPGCQLSGHEAHAPWLTRPGIKPQGQQGETPPLSMTTRPCHRSPRISLSDVEDNPPPNSPILETLPEADMKSKLEGFLLCGLESELEISSLENSSGVVTFTQISPPLVFLHLILTDSSQPEFARSRVTKHYSSNSTLNSSLLQPPPIRHVIFAVSDNTLRH